MKRIVSILLAVILAGSLAACKKSGEETLDDKIKKTQTLSPNSETQTSESLSADLENWRAGAEEEEDSYVALVPLTDYQVDPSVPYAKELQVMQGTLRALGQRLNQYYALYRIFPSGQTEDVLDSIKTKNPTTDDVNYFISCSDSTCTATATFNSNGSALRAEDNREGGSWPMLVYTLRNARPDWDGFIKINQYLHDQPENASEDAPAAVVLDDFIAHEEICTSLGGEMSKYGCVLKEKMSVPVKKNYCTSLGGEMKDGECVLKEEVFEGL